MIVVPLFSSLTVKDYGLFPGHDGSHNITVDFTKGLMLIAGVNGLGKTTLLTMLLRCLTGPYDFTSTGPPEQYGANLPKTAVILQRDALEFFSQRVADGAESALATLSLSFNGKPVIIQRQLGNLKLVELVVGGEVIKLTNQKAENEEIFQLKMTELFELAPFQNVLLILHNLIFFTETKYGALWDKNAQRHLLNAVFLSKKKSQKIDELGRTLDGADSRFRNIRSQHTRLEKRLNEALGKEAIAPDTVLKLKGTSEAIAGLSGKLEELEKTLADDYETRREKTLENERAKQRDEASRGAVERAKYTALLHSFPKMDDAARLMLSRILSNIECLVCGADAPTKKQDLELLLSKGQCPICESDPDKQKYSAPAQKFEIKKMDKAVKLAVKTAAELKKSEAAIQIANEAYEKRLEQVVSVRNEIGLLRGTKDKLTSLLPPDSDRVRGLKLGIEGLKSEMDAELALVNETRDSFGKSLKSVRSDIIKGAKKLSEAFGVYVEGLFSEEARLAQTKGLAKIGQLSGNTFEYPVFVPEMTAADRDDYTRRYRKSDVSESQRELIDLAFRLALFEVATANGDATFVMETPEASLDGIAMDRVGRELYEFSNTQNKRLIVTNNLTNTGMVTSLFGGKAKTAKAKAARYEHIFNLLNEAAPNRAVEHDSEAYAKLLSDAVMG